MTDDLLNLVILEHASGPIVECLPGGALLESERQALDLVAACGEAGTARLLIHGECLPPAFMDLSSGLAGAVLLKFSNYRVIAAVILPDEALGHGKFYEFALETNRGRAFRVFPERQAALAWLSRV